MFVPESFAKVAELLRIELRSFHVDYPVPAFQLEFDDYRRCKKLKWAFKIPLHSQNTLTIFEMHAFKGTIHLRQLLYRLLDSDGLPIFIVDTHGSMSDAAVCPHLEFGHSDVKVRLEEGDHRLHGLSLREFSVLDMWKAVRTYEERGELPFQTK